MKREYLFTSESVSEGHPDKMADQISDSVLDYIIKRDENARVACEVLLANDACMIAGEIKTKVELPVEKIVRDVIKDIGYVGCDYDYKTVNILNHIGVQSPDISQGVDRKNGNLGAGDQGLMFGYACKETEDFMPLPIYYAHKLVKNLSEVRKNNILDFLKPDSKSQVSVRYEDGRPVSIDTVVISTQHSPDISQDKLKNSVIEEVIKKTIPKDLLSKNTKYFINPTGRFVIGGPKGDTGLTGRKIIVDTYGGSCPHGGGAFSGKDPSKVDRSAAYALRYVAKNLVASGACDKVVIQIAYAIGIVEPVSIMVNTFGTGTVSDDRLEKCVNDIFDLTPRGIIDNLELLKPIYRETASYGHFGRSEFSWEKMDKIEEIKSYLNI